MADWIRYRRGMAVIASVPLLAIILAGCGITGGEAQSANETMGDNAARIWNLFVPIFWLSIVVFVLVQGALIWAVIKFRRKDGDEIPPQLHGNTKVEVAWTIAPAVILAVILVLLLAGGGFVYVHTIGSRVASSLPHTLTMPLEAE
jgi:cytochrome c oxidase subunit II